MNHFVSIHVRRNHYKLFCVCAHALLLPKNAKWIIVVIGFWICQKLLNMLILVPLTPGVEWRQKLDVQRGAVLANELRNNACKLAKWTVQALLAGSAQIKFGYVSRAQVGCYA